MGVFIEKDGTYENVKEFPTEGYEFNVTESYCTVNDVRDDSLEVNYDFETKAVSITPLTNKMTKCYMYFDIKKPSAKEQILANVPMGAGTPNFANTSCASGCMETTNGLYKSVDNDGDTYYFRGTVDNNWVKFANFYWRIIRINGDGTVRLIYNGKTNAQTGTATQIGTSAFNLKYNDNMYVGYMYESGVLHGVKESSAVKTYLEDWYNNYLVSHESKIDTNAGFCGDRTLYSGTGIGTVRTEYAAYKRLELNKNPIFECKDNNDLYTKKGANKGNAKLEQPVGLITADEIAYAGGVNEWGKENKNYYLHTAQDYWTMTPVFCPNEYASLFYMFWSGFLSFNFNSSVDFEYGIRPVINLRADTQFTGSGTSTDPFVVI